MERESSRFPNYFTNLAFINRISVMYQSEICRQFNEQFELIPAVDEFIKQDVYRLRYDVFCEELAYESAQAFPDGLETDVFDSHSLHCLLRHKNSNSWAGCIRVVLPKPESGLSLPCEKLFGKLDSTLTPPNSRVGEVSRLTVSPDFRRRKASTQFSIKKQRRVYPIIPISLYLASSAIALGQGLDYVFTMMEPKLMRHLRSVGIEFTQVGDLIEFNGKRGLYFISREDLLENLKTDYKWLLELARDQLLALA